MAEIVGAISGSVTLAGLVFKLREFGCQYRDVPQAWHEYVSYLEALDKIRAAIPTLLGEIHSPGQSLVTIEDEGGERLSAVLFCNDKLRKVINDAQDFLNKFDTGNGLLGRVFPRLRKYTRRAGFVFSEASVRQRIDSVTHVMRMLQVAIGLVALARSNSGHTATACQVEVLREAMQEQQASFRRLREEIRNDARTARLTADRQNLCADSSILSSLLNLRRLSLGSNASSWRTESLIGGDLWEADSARASRPPLPDSSHQPRRHELKGQLSTPAVPHEAVTTECQSHNQTDSSELDRLETVEVEFPDGKVVAVSLDPSRESGEGLLIAVDNSGARETESDIGDAEDSATEGCQSEAERFADFLESAAPSEAWSDPDESSSASQIPVRSQVDIFFPETIVASRCAPDPGPDAIFCIDRIIDDDDGQVFVAREPCQDLSCEHSSVRGLESLGLLERLPRRLILDVSRIRASWEADYRNVAPGGGEYLVVTRRCTPPCSHTAVEICGPRNPGCILSTYFEASVVPPASEPPESDGGATENAPSETGPDHPSEFRQRDSDRGDGCDRQIRSIDAGRNDHAGPDGTHSDQGGDVRQEGEPNSPLGPFSAVPCVFCGKDATMPRLESPTMSVSAFLYGSVSYGYRCSLCDGKNWFTGSRWIWN